MTYSHESMPLAARALLCRLAFVIWLANFALASLGHAQSPFVPSQLTPSSPPLVAQPGPVLSGEPYVDVDVYYDQMRDLDVPGRLVRPDWEEPWTWQVVPSGLIYRSYLAGVKESRLAALFINEIDNSLLLDATVGGRIALLRYGTQNPLAPEGFELDVEAAAFPRINLDRDWDMVSTDFRFGVPLTYGKGKWATKFGYYHLSSHLGDEQMLRYPDAHDRINFARDALVLGVSYYVNPSLRLYGETAWAFYANEGTDPWEFQFGIDYSPAGPTGPAGTPFLALNAHLREEVNYGGEFVAQTGWQWRGDTGLLLRTGVHFLIGQSNQYQFSATSERQVGVGFWYDY